VAPGHWATAAVLALAIGTVSWTASKAKISMPLRRRIASRNGAAWDWVNDLVSCPYCISHWLSFAAVACYRPWLIGGWVGAQFIVTSLAIVAGASVVMLVLKKLMT
jgi:hypothetical protein